MSGPSSTTDSHATSFARGRDWLEWLVLAIAASTLAAGLVQAIAPGLVLDLLDAESTATSRHFFAIVGMFMAVIGGALLQEVWSGGRNRTILLWSAIQKLGAAVAVTLGVTNDVFSALGLLIAANDLASSALLAAFLRRETS